MYFFAYPERVSEMMRSVELSGPFHTYGYT